MQNHISNVFKVCYFYIRWIRGIRPYISIEQTKSLVQTLVICRIDYCNSLFAGLSNALLARLERVMKVSARLIVKYPPRTPTHNMMKSLHWLKVKDRIRYKVLLMTWKCVNDQAPSYLNDLLVPYKPGRALRSTDKNDFVIPRTRTRYGERAFSYVAPALWNELPMGIRSLTSITRFKTALKTHLFKLAYD